jgi:beta-phosphoglucomutase
MTRTPPARACAVVFDLDGVLIDSYRPHLESWRMLARERGLPFSEEQFRPLFGLAGRDMISRLYGAPLREEEIAALYERKKALFREVAARGCPVVDGAPQLVDALHEAGFRLAIATSGPRESVEAALEEMGRREKFSAWAAAEDVARTKPDPALYRLAARRLDVAPRRCCAVEDAPAGIASARGAGMSVVGLWSPIRRDDDLREADLVVRSLRDLSPGRFAAIIGAAAERGEDHHAATEGTARSRRATGPDGR